MNERKGSDRLSEVAGHYHYIIALVYWRILLFFYRIKVEAGQFCRLRVTQQAGIDLILTLSDRTGAKVATVGGYKGYLKLTGLFPIQATLGDGGSKNKRIPI